MNLTIAGIVALVTLVIGKISKKFGWVNKKYIPYQNFVIGVISGVLVWVVDLDPNLLSAILTCLISSTSAGGIYDTYEVHTKTEGGW